MNACVLTLVIFGHVAFAGNHFAMKELEVDDTHPCKAENLKLAVSYYCDSKGKWYCQNGWTSRHNETEGYREDFQNPCSEPVCDPRCIHGNCVAPNVCACEVGWAGHTCDECITLGGCVHGGCTRALECNCDLGPDRKLHGKYTGTHCDIPKCRDECVHGVCDEPDVCRCENGWTGKTCNQCIPLPGCQNGRCNGRPNTCQCDAGWTGHLCDVPICARGCHPEHGHCDKPGECKCKVGWQNKTCTQCVPHWSCPNKENNACVEPNDCICSNSRDVNNSLCFGDYVFKEAKITKDSEPILDFKPMIAINVDTTTKKA